jgi:hypothetical protein
MGIHYTYKAQGGERRAKKQAKQMERQQLSHKRQLLKKQQTNNDDLYVVPKGVTLTLDMITDPRRNK